ncbi:hypothetical protein AB1207_22470 [Kineococcus endophyticus]|uniref:Lipoprotein n=1 Tax=Kineococcus endophyticus TaxID=1181883 RepID=A0ABV3PD02_9ACTN
MNHSEQATIDLGYQLATRDCMKKDGFDYQVVDARADPTPVDRRYGVWVENEAAQNGYETPADTPSQVKLQQLNSAANPEGWDASHLRCGQEAAKTYIANSLPSDLSAFQGYEDFMTLPQTKKVLDDWRQCLSSQNVNPPRDGWVPSSAMSGGKENEIKIALIDVKCKEENGTVQKLADIEASLQMPKVRADEPQLVDQRKAVDDALKAANKIIAANGL